MGVRDEEIQRLVSYIKGIGLTVTFSSKVHEDASALWYLDNSGIVIYKPRNTSKVDTVLSLIHEVGHAVHNIHEKDRQADPKFEEAVDAEQAAEELGVDTQKKYRKVILDNERAGTTYWHSIYKETNMKFPLWRLEAAMEFDVWVYEVFYETGEYPTLGERKAKLKRIKDRCRK